MFKLVAVWSFVPERQLDFFSVTQGDTAAALSRITENSAWRDSQMVESALHWKPPHVLIKYFPGGLSGFDSEDHYSDFL